MGFFASSWLWLLWLLPPLAVLYALAASRRKAAMGRFAEERFAEALTPGRSPGRSALRASVLGLALVGLIACLAGPTWGHRWEQTERRGVDVVVALDLSRSMLAEDVSPNRLVAAKREITDLLGMLDGDRVGLVVFAGTAFTQCPLTLDYHAFNVFLDQLDPDWVPVGGTDLGEAVRRSVDTFVTEERSSRAVILITDGEDHGGELDAAAEEAKKEGVHVFVVGIGSPQGVPIPDGQGGFIKSGGRVVLSKLDEPALKSLALHTGGSYVRSVVGMADLTQIYEEDIKGALEARALSSSRQQRGEERFQWFLLPTLLLLLLEPFLGPVRARPRRRRTTGKAGSGRPPTGLAAIVAAALSLAVASPAHAGWFDKTPARAGHSAFADGEYQQALDQWLTAQTDAPNDRRLDYNIGHAQFRLGNFPQAEESFRAAASGSDRELAADALYNAGNALVEQGRYLEAVSAYDESLEIRPEDDDAIVNRDIAQRLYEELLEQANNEQQQQEQQPEQPEQQEQQEDAETDEQEPGEEGEDGETQQKQEQQQGQGYSPQEQDDTSEESGKSEQDSEGDESEQEQQEGEDDGQTDPKDEESADSREEVRGGAASAADIDRDPTDGPDEPPPEGDIEHQTEEDPMVDDRSADVIEGALSDEEAEAMLRALETDQATRRQERTEREAARGRRGAAKDW